jgi:hypothetical protein
MGSGAGGRAERRIESCRCAGWQTKKYRRPDRPKRVETLKSAGVCGTACIGRAKQERFWEVRQATHTQDRQDRELCPNLHLTVEVLHLTTPPNPIPAQDQKRMRETKGRKSVFFRGWGGRFKKKNERISGCRIFAYHLPRFPLFP